MASSGPASDGDFEQWYRAEHARLVGALAVAAGNTSLAHEAAAEAFARAYARWQRVSQMASPAGWVRVVALNIVRRQQRRATLESLLLGRVARTAERLAPPPIVDPDLWDAVRSLPPQLRAVLALRVVLDLPQDEVANVLGIRPGTVSATLHSARRSLAAKLGSPEPDFDLTEVDHG